MGKKETSELFSKLNNYIKKYYLNELIKGGIYSIFVLSFFFLLFSLIEYFSHSGVRSRTTFFWLYILVNLVIFGKFIVHPLLQLLKLSGRLTYKQVAKILGDHFADIDDKLINILELSSISNYDNALIVASIEQKIKTIRPINFNSAINFKNNKKHLKWAGIPIVIILLFFISGKQYILTESSARIVRHNTFFEPQAPFDYLILNEKMNCIQFNSFTLKVNLIGNEIPNQVYLITKNNKFKLKKTAKNSFQYDFKRINSDVNFRFFAGGYTSKEYTIESLLQPKVVAINIDVKYPKHTKKKNETIENAGDIIISEGSDVIWNIRTQNSSETKFIVDNTTVAISYDKNLKYSKPFFEENNYQIISTNNNLKDTLSYSIKVIKDKFPSIKINLEFDSTNYNYLFNGEIEDDYLLTKAAFVYSIKSNDSLIFEDITIQKTEKELFFFKKKFNDFNLSPGDEITYYFQVWDNDEINGFKSSKSQKFLHQEPNINDLIAKKDAGNEKTKRGLNKSLSLAEEIQKDIDELNKIMIEKKKIGWQEKQKAKEILEKQKQLEKQIANTQKKNTENLMHKEKINSSILKKQKQLEQLMSKVLDEEMKKLLQEMEEMIDNANKEKLKDLLDKLNKENIDLDKELERELELFKQLEFEQKVEEILSKIDELKNRQKRLQKETEREKNNPEHLTKEQQELAIQMEEIKEELQDLREKNMALEQKNEFPNTENSEQEIGKKMQESKDALEEGKMKKSKKLQQNVIEEIEKLEAKLQNMQESSNNNKPEEDMETLRQILENLVTLSFDQESLLKISNNTSRNSPRFIKIVQQQNKLADDSKVIEDSLFSLSKRVIEIEATINKEITSIKSNMENATYELESRNIQKAVEKQQFVMTATNNLALLLSEILEQMQKELEMAPSKCNKPKNCNKPNPNCKNPSISELKKAQQKLNKKMQKGSDGQKRDGKKKGEKQSKELMQLAKEQEQIKNQLMQLRDELGENGHKGKMDKIIQDMEENESDIINNRITQETINRQQEILTRLLEAENSKQEREEDDKRESKEWGFELKSTSEKYLEYKKKKQQQEELLKTSPLQLTPFYKKKVNSYFNTIIKE